MAQDAVEMIMRGIQAGQAKNAKNQELTQRQQQIDSEVEARKAQTEFHTKELDNQKAFQDAQIEHQKGLLDLAKKASDMTLLKNQQDIQQHFLAGGEVPGDVQTPVGSGTGGAQMSPVNPAAATSIQHSVPLASGGSMNFTTPTREVAATTQANLARILGKPAEEVKTREMQAQQEAETVRRLQEVRESGAQRLQQINDQKEWDIKLKAATEAGENARNTATNKMHLEVARMMSDSKAASKGMDPNFPAQGVGAQVYDGHLSLEQLKKQYPKEADAISAIVQKSGGLPITDKEQNNLKDYEVVAAAVPLIKQMNDIVAQNRAMVLVPFSDAYKQYNSLHNQLLGKVPAISRVLSGVTRFNKQEMDNYLQSLIPSKNPSSADPTTNLNQLKTFAHDEIQNAFNTNFSRLPKDQRDHLRNSVGLNSLPYVGAQVNPQPQPAPQPTVPSQPPQPQVRIWTPNGIQ